MNSEFKGGLLGLIGTNLISILLIIVTLGIGTPWAVCRIERWKVNHTVIDGKKLVFDGTGLELFSKYIIWFLLTLVTVGIYSFWLAIKMKKWVTAHTHFAK